MSGFYQKQNRNLFDEFDVIQVDQKEGVTEMPLSVLFSPDESTHVLDNLAVIVDN